MKSAFELVSAPSTGASPAPAALCLALAIAATLLAGACGTQYGDPVGRIGAADAGSADAAPDAARLPDGAGAGDRQSMPPTPDGSVGTLSDQLPEFCTADGWCGADLTFSAVWGAAANDVWVAAKGLGDNPAASALLHYDGQAWTTVLGNAVSFYGAEQSDLAALWGSGSADVWAAGSAGALLHWNGAAWSGFYVGAATPLKAIWGSADDDVWAVGDAGSVVHWNGSAWEPRSGPYQPGGITSVDLSGVWGSAGDDVWAVGAGGVVLHWNGAGWSQYADAFGGTPTGADLKAVWGSAGDDVWAVGAGGVVLHWDGISWSISSATVPTTEALQAVWGSGRDDVWAAGAGGTLVHWTGVAWYTAPAQTAETLASVWSSGSGEIWAVGGRGAAVHWNGATWSATPARPLSTDLFAVFAAAPGEVWVAGAGGVIGRWDGTSWTKVVKGAADLRAIWAGPQDTVFVVGATGVILQCGYSSGFSVSCQSLATGGEAPPIDLTAVWAFDDSNIWIGGTGDALSRNGGNDWQTVPTPTRTDVSSIWGVAPDDVWVATDSDVVLHWDGATWSSVTLDAVVAGDISWRVVTGTASDDVWLTGVVSLGPSGSFPVVSHWDGSAWAQPVGDATLLPRLPSPLLVVGAWSGAPAELWLASAQGYASAPSYFSGLRSMMHWSAGAWSRSATGARTDLYAVSGDGADDLWAVGVGGLVLHRRTAGPGE
jgi:hypothetical protein